MPVKNPPRRFANFNNIDMLNALRKRMSNDYQARIPVITKANFDKVLRELDNYIPGQNAILSAIINKVGLTKFQADSWENTLAEFKKGELAFGESVEDVQMGLIEATAYDTDRETGERVVFSREDIELDSSYYQINRAERYKVTLDNKGGEIRKAFHNESGLNSFIDGVMAALQTSAEFDEFIEMIKLLSHYEEMGGFFKVQVPDIKTAADPKAAALTLLEAIREYSAEFAYPNRRFNAASLPTFAKPEDLIILATPAVVARLDVQGLAPIFHLDKADVPARIITIPADKWEIPGAQAILTTVNFFQVYDVLNTMTEIENPAMLYSNHWLHVHQIIAYSRFVPAILFTTEEGTDVTEVEWTVTGLGATTIQDIEGADVTTVKRGDAYNMSTTATVSDPIGDTGVGYALEQPGTSRGTRMGISGVLLVAHDEKAEELSYRVFSAADPSVSEVRTIDVVGTIYEEWPIEVTEPTP